MSQPPGPLTLLRRATAFWTDRVDAIRDDQWTNPTPCTGWTVRQLLIHVIERDRGLASQVAGGPRDDDRARRYLAGELVTLSETDDLKQRWHEQWNWWASRLDDPAVRDRTMSTPIGEMTFADAAARLNTVELAIHGWDLSRALGMDDRIDPELVALGYQYFSAVDRSRLPPGVLGDPVPVPSSADQQEQLLALAGRRC
jgi:uncharacterized protein (TIGR03086 family)